MKIALFVDAYLPYINGVVTHVKVLRDGLEKFGHEVMVVTADPTVSKHIVDHKNVLRCPAKSSKRLYEYGLSFPISAKRLNIIKEFNPDIIHIHQEFGIGFSGFLCAKMLKKPLVYTMHTMYDEYLYYVVPHSLIPAAKKITHTYAKILASGANQLTGPSKKIEEFFRSCGVKKEVNVIPNSLELDKFNLNAVEAKDVIKIREEFNFEKGQMIACFVGRLGKEKSIDILLEYFSEAIKKEDDIRLFIVGGGPYLDTLKELASSLNIDDMVSFTGSVEHDKLPPYLAACDCYVTASLSDTNSISMKEGMALGLPVLQRLDRLNEDQVVDGINGFVFNSPSELREKLLKVKNLDTLNLTKLKASVINSVQSAGADSLAEYMISVYEKAIYKKLKKKRKFKVVPRRVKAVFKKLRK